jgi:hypothetical protein
MTKANRNTLQVDLAIHTARRDEIKRGENIFFLKRTNYSPLALIDSYDRIIKSIRAELKGEEL